MENRDEKLARIRAEIAIGKYLTPERIEIASRKLMLDILMGLQVDDALEDTTGRN